MNFKKNHLKFAQIKNLIQFKIFLEGTFRAIFLFPILNICFGKTMLFWYRDSIIFLLPQDFVFLGTIFFAVRKRLLNKNCLVTITKRHFLGIRNHVCRIWEFLLHGKNGFVTATKLGTKNNFFVTGTKNFAATTKRFDDRTKHFVVVTKYFSYPYFTKWFCWYNKTFFLFVSFREFRWNRWEGRKPVRELHAAVCGLPTLVSDDSCDLVTESV